MKTLNKDQYLWLLAIKRGNHTLANEIGERLPADELFARGLYTYTPHWNNTSRMENESAKLTPNGLLAIECYNAIHGLHGLSYM
jgi:hypothetical protein